MGASAPTVRAEEYGARVRSIDQQSSQRDFTHRQASLRAKNGSDERLEEGERGEQRTQVAVGQMGASDAKRASRECG